MTLARMRADKGRRNRHRNHRGRRYLYNLKIPGTTHTDAFRSGMIPGLVNIRKVWTRRVEKSSTSKTWQPERRFPRADGEDQERYTLGSTLRSTAPRQTAQVGCSPGAFVRNEGTQLHRSLKSGFYFDEARDS